MKKKICLRCKQEYTNPAPEVVNPSGNKEIATSDWCPDCNAFAMAILYRNDSAYGLERGRKIR